MEGYYLLTFENTHNAIKGESILKERNIKNIVMPTPTSITKSCGICLRIDEDKLEDVKKLVKEDMLKIKAVYLRNAANFSAVEL